MLRTIFLLSLCVWLDSHGFVEAVQCRDENNYCQIWSSMGECQKNPDYMLVYCKKSCKVCTGCTCGEVRRESNRILGGEETDENEYPWMVKVLSSFSNWEGTCGGSLISNEWVLTAAHCVRRGKKGEQLDAYQNMVVLGWHNTNTQPLLVTSAKAFIHEQYSDDQTNHNDIALLKLDSPVEFDKNPLIRPICLPSNTYDDYGGYPAVLAGWGHTCDTCPPSTVLMDVNVRVLSRRQCQERYNFVSRHIHESWICTTSNSKPKGSCQGDSGGPLMHTEPGKNSYTLIGAPSWNYGPWGIRCSSVTYPAGMTNVAHFLDWITEKIQGSERCSRRN